MDPLATGAGASGTAPKPLDDREPKSGDNGSDNDATALKREDNQFQKAISTWKSVGLGKLVPQLDKSATEIVDSQKEAVVQRKELAQKTKDFRKLDDANKLTEIKTLLRAYQNFVDLLTNHQKSAASSFLQVYSSISEAPDPYPLLEASIDALINAEDIPRLNAENERLQRSVREKTKSAEDLDAQLQKERALRKELEGSRESKAHEIEANWQAVLAESKEVWEAKEKALEEKLENQERLFNEVKASLEVNQRLGTASSTENSKASASAAELEIVSSDLERTSQRLADAESRNEQLRTQLAQASSQDRRKADVEDDPAFLRLREENESLLRQVDSANAARSAEEKQWEAKTKGTERDLQFMQRENSDLRDKLSKWKDYPELKRELDVFRAIEFSTGDDDEDGAPAEVDASNMNGAAKNSKQDSLEQLLLARNKKLSDEMAVMRVSLQELRRDLEQSQENASVANAELERVQHLNTTLENDLQTLQNESANQFSAGRSVAGSRYPASSWGRTGGRRSSPTSSIISGFDSSSRIDAPGGGEGGVYGGGSGMLPLVQAQRDRFKQKISQLEGELSKQYSTVASLRQEVQSLQKDNLNLYEKTRYVSTYQRSVPGGASSSSYAAAPPPSTVPLSDANTSSGLTLDRYRSAYEASLSPFAAFRGREASRAVRRLTLPERVAYNIMRVVLASRTTRNLFALYCVALHLLVFMMLYWMGNADVSKHASKLGDAALSAAAGGAAAGGEAGLGGAGELHHGEWRQEDIEGVTGH